MPNSFDLNAEYGPSPFDITHILNSTFRYELPFGKGRFFGTGSALDKIVGGWYVFGHLYRRSGDALTVTQGAGVWGAASSLASLGAIPTVDPKFFRQASIPASKARTTPSTIKRSAPAVTWPTAARD